MLHSTTQNIIISIFSDRCRCNCLFGFTNQKGKLAFVCAFIQLCLICKKCRPKRIRTKIVAVCFCFIKRTLFKYMPPNFRTLTMFFRLPKYSNNLILVEWSNARKFQWKLYNLGRYYGLYGQYVKNQRKILNSVKLLISSSFRQNSQGVLHV